MSFSNLCIEAATDFLQTAVFIDNDIVLGPDDDESNTEAIEPEDFAAAAFGKKTSPSNGSASSTKSPSISHVSRAPYAVNAETIVDSFLGHKIICCTVRPDQSGSALKALDSCVISDIVILDWHLDSGNADSTKSRDLITDILKRDASTGGRARLICVYTAQKRLRAQARLLHEDLKKENTVGTFRLEQGPPVSIRGSHAVIIFVNKIGTIGHLQNDPIKSLQDLPTYLVERFAELNTGMLPATTLGAIAAIRKATHHILATFTAEMDGAFNGHRLMIPNKDDAIPFILELLVDEIKNTILRSDAATSYSGSEAFKSWLDRGVDFRPIETPTQDQAEIRKLLREILEFVASKPEKYQNEVFEKIKLSFPQYSRNTFTKFFTRLPELFYSSDVESSKNLLAFSEIVQTSHCLGPRLAASPDWIPILTLGTVLRPTNRVSRNALSLQTADILVCVQPRCDCLRISPQQGRNFPFLVGRLTNEKPSIVVGGKKFYVDPSLQNIVMARFVPDQNSNGVIEAVRTKTKWILKSFKSSFEWIAEMRPFVAQQLASNLGSQAGSVALEQFEWLRKQ